MNDDTVVLPVCWTGKATDRSKQGLLELGKKPAWIPFTACCEWGADWVRVTAWWAATAGIALIGNTAAALRLDCNARFPAAPPPSTIDRFRGEYAFLSNFHASPLRINDTAVLGREVIVPTVEHGYQMSKTVNALERLCVLNAVSPTAAKQLGGHVALRADWSTMQRAVMHYWVHQKFTQHPHLRAKLTATGDAQLVEGNTHGDTYWGVCGGEGTNWLGRILMDVRTQLRGGAL